MKCTNIRALIKVKNQMNQQPKHTEPTTNSYVAAYGYEYVYDGFKSKSIRGYN